MRAPWVASRWSRLLADCNRAPEDPGLILGASDGVPVPGNLRVTRAQREQRIAAFHEPFHAAVDRTIRRCKKRSRGAPVRLLALHSFTPVMAEVERNLDVGVLYDAFPRLAHRLGAALRRAGHRVRYNEPYSGLAGLIYSARRHGLANGIEYVELEVNNALLRSVSGIERMARDVACALRALDGSPARGAPAEGKPPPRAPTPARLTRPRMR